MATKGEKREPGRWRGDAVEEAPGVEAEQGADRAEGSAPVRADDEARRQQREREAEPREPAEERGGGRSASRGGLSPDERIAEAAEEHREHRPPGERPPRGKL